MDRSRSSVTWSAVATGAYVALFIVVSLFWKNETAALTGWTLLYAIGLCWAILLIERVANRIERLRARGDDSVNRQRWNPFDPGSRLYGFVPSVACFLFFAALAIAALAKVLATPSTLSRSAHDILGNIAIEAGCLAMLALASVVAQGKRLRQSVAMLGAYSVLFALIYFLVHLQFGNKSSANEYDLPSGGGTDSIKASSVKVQRIIRKKFVVNPYSNVIFDLPPIDKIELKLTEETANQYKAGQGGGGLGKGDGKGGGFGNGTGSGMYGFVRLRHSDREWNKNFGVGGDRNLLAYLKDREPLTKIAEETTSIDYTGIAKMSPKKPLPLLYICGAQTFSPTTADKHTLRQYLTEKHGMILGDNLGGGGFHNSFVAAMTEITGVNPVIIPRDDRIHQRPYELPQLPLVVAHGGTSPLGWKIDGRWVAYYHPGALSDAWRDDHAGIKKEVWDQCYQLGINILYYAYSEQDSWRQAQQR